MGGDLQSPKRIILLMLEVNDPECLTSMDIGVVCHEVNVKAVL